MYIIFVFIIHILDFMFKQGCTAFSRPGSRALQKRKLGRRQVGPRYHKFNDTAEFSHHDTSSFLSSLSTSFKTISLTTLIDSKFVP